MTNDVPESTRRSSLAKPLGVFEGVRPVLETGESFLRAFDVDLVRLISAV